MAAIDSVSGFGGWAGCALGGGAEHEIAMFGWQFAGSTDACFDAEERFVCGVAVRG